MDLPVAQYFEQVAHGKKTARRIQVFAAISWIGGWVVIIICGVEWLFYHASLTDTLDVMLAIGVGGLLGGVGLYATSTSLSIAASRMEIDLVSKFGPPPS